MNYKYLAARLGNVDPELYKSISLDHDNSKHTEDFLGNINFRVIYILRSLNTKIFSKE